MPNFNDQFSTPNGKSVYPLNVLGKIAAKPFYIWVNDDCSNKSDSFTEAKAVRLELFNDGGATAYIVDADGVEVVDAEIEAHEVLAKHDYFAGARKPEIRPDCSGAFMVNDPQDPDGYAIVGDDIAALILEARDHLLTKSPVRDLPISTEKSSSTADAKSSHVDGEVIGIDGDGCLIQWDGQAGVAYNSGHDVQGFGMDNLSQLEKERLNMSGSGLASFDYQLLARLQQDCDYYLGHGNRSRKHLWAGGEAEQIAKMKELYSGLKEKPEWISLDDIDTYEARMLNFVTHPSSGKTGTFAARFDQHADRNGQSFKLIGTVDSGAYDKAECGEMFVVRFADGVEIHAWPEEVQSALNAVDGKAQLAFDQKMQGKVSNYIERPHQVQYVIHSLSESDVDFDGAVGAFWSNEDGWGSLQAATLFTTKERMSLTLPMSAKQDAEWMLAVEARDLNAKRNPQGNVSMPIEAPPATKLVEVRLSALTRVEYMEVVEVPANITQAELDDLVSARYRQVDGGEFTSDPEYWERGTCEAVDSDMPDATPTMMAFRTEHGLHIERADAASQTVDCSGPTP